MTQKDPIGNIIIITLLLFLVVAGIISYKSIDSAVLQRLEKQQLILPTPIISSTQVSTISPTLSTSSAIKQ